MKIALASAPVKNLDIDFNLQAIVDAMAACSGKADLNSTPLLRYLRSR